MVIRQLKASPLHQYNNRMTGLLSRFVAHVVRGARHIIGAALALAAPPQVQVVWGAQKPPPVSCEL